MSLRPAYPGFLSRLTNLLIVADYYVRNLVLLHWHVDCVAHLDVKVIHVCNGSLAGDWFWIRSEEYSGEERRSEVVSRRKPSSDWTKRRLYVLKNSVFAGRSAVAQHGAEIEARQSMVELRLQERLQRELAYR